MHYINLRHGLRWSIDAQVLIRCNGAIARVSKNQVCHELTLLDYNIGSFVNPGYLDFSGTE